MNAGRVCGLLLSVLACTCSGSDGARPDSRKGTPASTATVREPAPSAPASSDASPPLFAGSIYDLPVVVKDQDGNDAPIDVFRGHPVLVTMFYSRCPSACPVLTTDLKRIDQRLPDPLRDRVRVLMVSFDAANDTPAALLRYARERNLDTARWKLANASEESARDLAAALGIRYRKLDNGAFYHTSAIVLLDEQGRPKARVEGLGQDPAPILSALK